MGGVKPRTFRTFKPLGVPVRAAHLETPRSYLRRLCEANAVDPDYATTQVRRRKDVSSDPASMGHLIHELGGPPPTQFQRCFDFAAVGLPTQREPYERRPRSRFACVDCTAGLSVATYDHIRFQFCGQHGRWLGVGHSIDLQRPRALDHETWRAESRLRRLVAQGHVQQGLLETVWESVRDNAFMSAGLDWSPRLASASDSSNFTREVDDRLALFPETVRVVDTIVRHGVPEMMKRRGLTIEERRANMYDAFQWVPGERWVLVERLTLYFREPRNFFRA